MPGTVSEASVLHAQSHSQPGRGRPSAAHQAASPFSELVGDPEQDQPAPERPETTPPARNKPAARDQHTPAKRRDADAAEGAAKAKTGGSKDAKDQQTPEAEDLTQADAPAAPDEAKAKAKAAVAVTAEAGKELKKVAGDPSDDGDDTDTAAPDSGNAAAAVTIAALIAAPVPVPAGMPSQADASAATNNDADPVIATAPTITSPVAAATLAPADAPADAAELSAQPASPNGKANADQSVKADAPAPKTAQPSGDKPLAQPAQSNAPAAKAAQAAHLPAPQSHAEKAAAADSRADAPIPGVDVSAGKAAPDPAANTNANAAPPVPAPQAPAHPAQVAASSAQAPQAAAVPVAGLAVEIAARAHSGKNHFEIRLDPPELGRIDVRLHVDHDGNVTSRLVVDRSETLDLLRRDAPNLERALQDAGLKTADNGLQFSLRDQGFSGRDQNSRPQGVARLVVPEDKLAATDIQPSYGRLTRLGGGVDIRV